MIVNYCIYNICASLKHDLKNKSQQKVNLYGF